MNLSKLDLDFNLNTAGKLKLHQSVNGLSCRAVDVDETLEGRKLELLTCLFVYEGTTVYCENTLVRWKGNRSANNSAGSLYGLHDLLS